MVLRKVRKRYRRHEGVRHEILSYAHIMGKNPGEDDVLAAEYQAERIGVWWLDPIFFGKYPENLLKSGLRLMELIPTGYDAKLQRRHK